MTTLPRSYKSDSNMTRPSKAAQSNGQAAAMPANKHKKSKRLSWTLGRKKSRDEPYVADGSGEDTARFMIDVYSQIKFNILQQEAKLKEVITSLIMSN